MGAWVFASCVAWLCSYSRDEFGTLPPLAPGRLLAGLPDGPRRTAGRVLGRLVLPGLSLGQVRWLIGEHQPRLKPLPTVGLVGGALFARFGYENYGLSVTFLSDAAGVLRVGGIVYNPNRASVRP